MSIKLFLFAEILAITPLIWRTRARVVPGRPFHFRTGVCSFGYRTLSKKGESLSSFWKQPEADRPEYGLTGTLLYVAWRRFQLRYPLD
jgi:hypothetical protein